MNINEELAKYKNIIDLELEKTIPNSDLMQKKILKP